MFSKENISSSNQIKAISDSTLYVFQYLIINHTWWAFIYCIC